MAKKYFSGFTLIELIIVLAIIAILAALIVVLYTGQISKGNDATRKADIDIIKIAVEEYEKDHNCYPSADFMSTCNPGAQLQPYLDKIPCDPVTKKPYAYEPSCSTNGCCPIWYRFYGSLQNTQDTSITAGLSYLGSSYNYVSSSDNAPPIGVTPYTGLPFFGCRSGKCVQIFWDYTRPPNGGPQCDPSYTDKSCYGQCGNPANQCVSWH